MNRATLVALLSVYGPRSSAELARLAGRWRWWTLHQLHTLYEDYLVDCVRGGVWRLTDRGHQWAAALREDELRFARLTRTRS